MSRYSPGFSPSHRHVVLSVPRRLRLLFRRNRGRLARLARAAWETGKDLLQAAAGDKGAVPGGVACLQTYGNLLDRHPHVHLLVSWGTKTSRATAAIRPSSSATP